MHLDCFEVSCRVLEISAIEISALTEQDEPVSPDNPPYQDIVPPKNCNMQYYHHSSGLQWAPIHQYSLARHFRLL